MQMVWIGGGAVMVTVRVLLRELLLLLLQLLLARVLSQEMALVNLLLLGMN